MIVTYKDTLTFSDSFSVTETIRGIDIRFFPTRHAYVGDLAKVSGPMLGALSSLFIEAGREETAITESMKDADGLEITKITVQAVTPELAAHKSKERREAIETIIQSIQEANNRILIGRLLMDSMRDLFPYKRDRAPAEVLEFLEGNGKDSYEGIDIPTQTLMIGGFIKANAKSFGTVGETLVGAVKTKLSVLRETSPTEAGTAPTDGDSNSKTASSSPQAEDSQSSSSTS